jgi:hypothetical protein
MKLMYDQITGKIDLVRFSINKQIHSKVGDRVLTYVRNHIVQNIFKIKMITALKRWCVCSQEY